MENQKGVIQVSKRYMVKVNGKMYEVEVEEMGNGSQPAQQYTKPSEPAAIRQPAEPAASAPKPQASKPEAPKSQPAAASSGSEEKVQAPMSGVIVKIEVRPGDTVKDSQTLIILEAMKMENEILAPHDCKIKEILVREGQQVEIDQPLLVIE